MTARRPLPRCLVSLLLILNPLLASEYHGTVTFGGLPVPGASVTASQDNQKLPAITDQQGAFSFPDLHDGAWTIDITMPGFAPVHQDITIPAASPPAWDRG